MKARIDELSKIVPGLEVEERSILTNIGTLREKGIMTVPAYLINGEPHKGVMTVNELKLILEQTQTMIN